MLRTSRVAVVLGRALRPVACARLDCVEFVNTKRFNVALGMGGKGITKYKSPEGKNHEMIAAVAAREGNYELIENMLETIKRPSIEIYNSLIKAYIRGKVYGKIALVLDKLEDNEQPSPTSATFFPLILEYTDMGMKSHARNVLFKAAEYGCVDITVISRLFEVYLKKDDFHEVLLLLRCMESTELFDEDIYEALFEYISGQGSQGYELLKRYIVYLRDILHAPIRKHHKEMLLFSAIHSPKKLEIYDLLEHMMETYPHFQEYGPNHVADHLMKLTHAGEQHTDKIRRIFYRCVARGFRFSDDLVNEIVLNYYRRGDHENVFRMFQVIQRDVYQIFTETHVPIIKSALYLASEESLSIVPRLVMESIIPEDYRVALVQMMVDIASDTHNDVPIARELDVINEYLKENTMFTPQLNFVMLDYHIAQNDLEKAKDLLAMTLDRYYSNSLRRNPPVNANLEFSSELSATIESLTKSSYRNIETEIPSQFVVPDGYEATIPKPKPYDEFLDPELVKKYSGDVSGDEGDSNTNQRNRNTKQRGKRNISRQGNQSSDDAVSRLQKDSFSLNFDAPKPNTSKPFFSKLAVEGNLGTRRKDEFSHIKKTKELPQEVKLRKTKIDVDFDPIISEPTEAAALGRDFKTERKFALTGLEGLAVKEPVESTSVDYFQDVINQLPRLRVLEDLVNERFSRIDPAFDESSSEFEYNAINEIQARNHIAEDFSEIVEKMWENLLTHAVACYDVRKATDIVDELITRVPFAAPPSNSLCDTLGLPKEWRSQFD